MALVRRPLGSPIDSPILVLVRWCWPLVLPFVLPFCCLYAGPRFSHCFCHLGACTLALGLGSPVCFPTWVLVHRPLYLPLVLPCWCSYAGPRPWLSRWFCHFGACTLALARVSLPVGACLVGEAYSQWFYRWFSHFRACTLALTLDSPICFPILVLVHRSWLLDRAAHHLMSASCELS